MRKSTDDSFPDIILFPVQPLEMEKKKSISMQPKLCRVPAVLSIHGDVTFMRATQPNISANQCKTTPAKEGQLR